MKKTLFLFLLFPVSIFGQTIKISSASFEYTPSIVAKKKVYFLADAIKIKPDGRLAFLYRIRLNIKNESSRVCDGLVFKYSLRIILKKGETIYKDIPFQAEELRVSRVSASGEKKVYIYNLDLKDQLRRLKNSGFEPNALELEIAKEPRKEDERFESLTFSIPFALNSVH